MTIPAAKIRQICTSSEIKLVRASRKPELERLSRAQVKRLVDQARKLFDKWRDLGRGQSRARSGEVGFGAADANTELKTEIFRDALASFEARLAKLDASPSSAAAAAKKSPPKAKKLRSSEHRATRAAVRKGMAAVEDLLNAKGAKRSAPVAKAVTPSTPSPETAPAVESPTNAKPKLAPNARPVVNAKPAPKRTLVAAGVGKGKQLSAAAAAKRSRIVRSGKTTRMLGHANASGKRAQARRDAKS